MAQYLMVSDNDIIKTVYLFFNCFVGVVHHDDLIYLFYISKLFPEFKQSDPESLTSDKITLIWSNFARTG